MRFDEETAFWHLEAWAWMMENFGGFRKFSNTRLNPIDLSVLRVSPTDSHEKFEMLFETVKESMGMSDWPCNFESLESVEEIQRFLDDRREKGEGEYTNNDPAGLFALGDGDEVSIYYSRLLAERPAALLSTIVHELCHYLFTTAKEAPPSGWENHEYYTDAAVVFAGYGVFACNSAFEFQQYTDGIMGG